ncbi:hypothetical protein [Candidatus Poriferisodalis sp.]|uniref:hypothetical protein n=1 Tax=Candidatus Poriferisodalis sp. TaxID=3101277 RepID=UPI003B015A94
MDSSERDASPQGSSGVEAGSQDWPPPWAREGLRRWEDFVGTRFGRGLAAVDVGFGSPDVANAALERILTGRCEWQLFYLGPDSEILEPALHSDDSSAGNQTRPHGSSESPASTQRAVSVCLESYETALAAVVEVLGEIGVEDPHWTAVHDFHVDEVLMAWPPLFPEMFEPDADAADPARA